MKTKLFKVLMLVLLLVVNAAAVRAPQNPQTVDSLIHDLTSSNTEVADKAALKLFEMREAALPKLFAFIKDENDKSAKLLQAAVNRPLNLIRPVVTVSPLYRLRASAERRAHSS